MSVLAAATVIALQGLGASSTSAVPLCPPVTFVDSTQHVWDFNRFTGALLNGGGSDAYADWGEVSVGNDLYVGPVTCDTTAARRQYDLSEVEMSGLRVSRKVFAPAEGIAFGRSITFLRNPNAAPITVTLTFQGAVGSLTDTKLLATSSGDSVVVDPADDSWVVSADSLTNPNLPPLAHVFDSSAAGIADHVDHLYGGFNRTDPWVNGEEAVRAVYEVTVPAGATVSYMQVEAQRDTIDEAKAAAPALGAQPPEVFAGLSAAEILSLRNWQGFDVDRDGVATQTDNCHLMANGDQANLDGDALGDVCDPDIDNDGVTNADEAIRRTDPRKVDTDGDGIDDAKDLFPTGTGSGTDGSGQRPTPTPTATPPTLALGVPRTVKLKALLKGIKVSATPNMASTLRFDLLASAKGAQIAKSYNLVLATTTVSSASGKQSVRLKPKRKLIGRSRRFALTLRVTATNTAGLSTASSTTISVKR